jgi:hypothetical protein
LTFSQKTGFLETYACLILLNYTRVSELDSSFLHTTTAMKDDDNPEIRTNAALVVKMYEMYLAEERFYE